MIRRQHKLYEAQRPVPNRIDSILIGARTIGDDGVPAEVTSVYLNNGIPQIDILQDDGVKYVIVFKLSRFGRNTLDILKSLDVMKKHDVHLISVEDNLYSDSPAGKIMISILSLIKYISIPNFLSSEV